MNLFQALAYFFREAAVSLGRSWKVSLLAVVTITVSLTVGGGVLLAASGLAARIEEWRRDARVVVYLDAEATAAERDDLRVRLAAAPWAARVDEIGAAEAAARFRRAFPGLADLVVDGGARLPESVELLPARGAAAAAIDGWSAEIAAHPAVEAVEDDRRWLGELDALVAVGRGAGLLLGGVLLGAAVFTIASVVRLTAFLYQDEIAVMRLVGATEFYIRGPFYAEGLLQGLLGGTAAAAALAAGFRLLAARAGDSLAAWLVAGEPLVGWREAALLVALGAAAGLGGALLSLSREELGRAPIDGSQVSPQT
ncbi:MAG TPA: permease-like cell division protein FtsX [Thermoanaerobaculia bacterium]